MAEIEEDCCNDKVDLSKVNPFNGVRAGKISGWGSRLREIDIPIPEELKNKDTEKMRAFFRAGYNFIPFSGSDHKSSHTILQRMFDFKQLSVTVGACIESRKTWAFGSTIDIVGNYDPIFNLGETEVTPENKIKYRDFLKAIDLGKLNWMDLRCNMSEYYDSTGNVYLEIVLNENFGERKAGIHLRDPRDCMYNVDEDGNETIGICSHWFDEKKFKKHPPKLLPLFPIFHEYEDGSIRSILHIKNGTGCFYGRAKSFSSFIDQYNEYKNRMYQAKQLNVGFIGHTIIEIEADAPAGDPFDNDEDAKSNNEGYKDFVKQAEENYTAKGDNPTSVIVSERPFGAKPMEVHNIPANTDHKYFEGMGNMSSRNIIMAFDWSESILKMNGGTGFSENMYKDIFKIKSVTAIKALQTAIDSPINMVVDFIMEWMGQTELKGIGQKSVSPIQDLIEEIANAEEGTGKADPLKIEDNAN